MEILLDLNSLLSYLVRHQPLWLGILYGMAIIVSGAHLSFTAFYSRFGYNSTYPGAIHDHWDKFLQRELQNPLNILVLVVWLLFIGVFFPVSLCAKRSQWIYAVFFVLARLIANPIVVAIEDSIANMVFDTFMIIDFPLLLCLLGAMLIYGGSWKIKVGAFIYWIFNLSQRGFGFMVALKWDLVDLPDDFWILLITIVFFAKIMYTLLAVVCFLATILRKKRCRNPYVAPHSNQEAPSGHILAAPSPVTDGKPPSDHSLGAVIEFTSLLVDSLINSTAILSDSLAIVSIIALLSLVDVVLWRYVISKDAIKSVVHAVVTTLCGKNTCMGKRVNRSIKTRQAQPDGPPHVTVPVPAVHVTSGSAPARDSNMLMKTFSIALD